MAAGDLLRLAWEAEHDGRAQLRDSLLTMAIVESGPGDAWAERCRTRLLADHPGHFLAKFPSVGLALVDDRVVQARERLRVKYPPAKVQSLLLRAGVRRGPYLGRVESLDAMLEDLAGPSAEAENVRRDAPEPSRGPLVRRRIGRPVAFSLAYPSMIGPEFPVDEPSDPDAESPIEDFSLFYVTVLLGIAFLLASVQEHRESHATRA